MVVWWSLWGVVWAVAALVRGTGASSTPLEGAKQQGLFHFEYPLGKVQDLPVAFASFSEAPGDDIKANMSVYTGLRVFLVFHPVTGPTWELDADIGLWTNLQVLLVPGLLRGTLPSQLGLLSDCRMLDVRSGALTGSIPSELGLLTNAAAVQLSDNRFSGTIPSQWGQLTPLVVIELASTDLEGSIPSQLALLRNAADVLLSSNALTGTLSPALFDPRTGWTELKDLEVNRNQLSGPLPSELGACTRLTRLYAYSNGLSGSVPSQLGQLAALQKLGLQDNRLQGTIPSQLGRLSALVYLALAQNSLTGPIPVEFGQLTALAFLWLDYNSLSGSVPAAVFALPLLSSVVVSHNTLRGRIPADASDVWREGCHYSGLDDPSCDFDCPTCAVGQFQLVECRAVGQGPVCVEWWAVVAALAGCLAVCLVLAKSILPHDATARQLCVTSGRLSFAAVDLVVDFLFALNAHGMVQLLSFVTWGGVLAVSLFATLGLTFAHKLWLHPVRLAGACVLCTLNASCLVTLTNTNVAGVDPATLKRHQKVLLQVALWLALAETLFQGALQFVSVVLGDRSTITLLSLCFSVFRAVSMFTVSVVLALAREPNDPCQHPTGKSEGIPPSREEAKARRGRKRRGVVVALLACLLPAIAMGPAFDDARGRRATVTGSASLALAPPEPRLYVAASNPQDASTTMSGPKSEFGCSLELFDVRLPYICSLGHLAALFIFEQLGAGSVDLDFVAAEASSMFVFVALSPQPISSVLGQLTGLVALLLEYADAQLPTQVGQLSQLMLLRNAFTSFSNTVPSEIARAPRLIDISFVENRIVGPLPSQITLLTDISFLDASGNADLSGTLPSQLGLLRKLFHINMQATGIGGPLPSELGNCPSLREVDLDSTRISGAIPSQLGRCGSLEMLVLSRCQVSGALPTQIYLLTALTTLVVTGISGSLGTEIAALSHLRALQIDSPHFVGTLPTQLGQATALTSLDLVGGDGDWSGSIPTQLSLLTRLTGLTLQDRGLRGTVPSELGLLTALTALSLGNNALDGTLPSQLALLTALETFNITSNRLSGTFPDEFGDAWRGACDHSGIKDDDCRRSCPSCAFGSLELRSCDAWGNGQMCVPPFIALLVLVCFVGTQVFVVRKLDGVGNGRPKVLLHGALVAAVSATHLLFDWTFALDADKAIQVTSVTVLSIALLARLILVAAELLRVQRQDHGADITKGMFLVVLAVAVCVVDPFTLKRALRSGERLAAKLAAVRVLRRVLVVVLLSDAPMTVLQLVRIGTMGTPSWVVVTALACTLLSLVVGSRYWPCVRPPPNTSAVHKPQGNWAADDAGL